MLHRIGFEASFAQVSSNPENTSTKIHDFMKMYYRTHCHKTYGGFEWLAVLIALGDVPPLAVDIANRLVSERVRAKANREANFEPSSGPRLSAQNLARSQGAPVPPVRGPTHNISAAKQARTRAKALEKQMNRSPADSPGASRAQSLPLPQRKAVC